MKTTTLALCALCLVLASGCVATDSVKTWSLEHVNSVKGFKTPECAEVDPADGTVYISNIFAVTRDAVKALDSNGFIATLAPGGKVKDLNVVKSTDAMPVHGPSGMVFFNGYLYFNDRNNLKRYVIGDLSTVEVVPVPGTDHGFNDAGCDADYVYVTGQDAVFRVDRNGKGGKFVDLKGVNGVKGWRGKLFAETTDVEARAVDRNRHDARLLQAHRLQRRRIGRLFGQHDVAGRHHHAQQQVETLLRAGRDEQFGRRALDAAAPHQRDQLLLEFGEAVGRAVLQAAHGLRVRALGCGVQAVDVEQVAGRITARERNHARFGQVLEQFADRRAGGILE